ncbi:MAG: hypothetical protein WDZ46_09720 [Solirubrobacterales bacterium]
MFTRLRKHFGTAGLLVAVVALVAALGGSAVAANSGDGATASAKKKNKKKRGHAGLNGKQKRQVIALAKRFAGNGPQGPQGVPGVPGPAGPKGDKGDSGQNGSNGSDGADGADGLDGEDGATGATGPTGEEGSPWTAGGTLPEGETLTGSWGVDLASGFSLHFDNISFPLPVASGISSGNTHTVPVGGPVPAACDDGVAPAPSAANPEADPGKLCVFAGFFGGEADFYTELGSAVWKAGEPPQGGASPAGAVVAVEMTAAGEFGYGTYAVTAPLAP